MAFLKREEIRNSFCDYYTVKGLSSRSDLLGWFADATTKVGKISYIKLDDFESFHDGTDSTYLESIDNTEDFVLAWEASGIKLLTAAVEAGGRRHIFLCADLENARVYLLYSRLIDEIKVKTLISALSLED